eukprot:GHVU01015608.1.p1 GENE.GHVU01015608.1~~GHVU01015608.1.p1  ORF type:complete len:175 (+),score=23.75 GHVU01015608.1:1-525(+)
MNGVAADQGCVCREMAKATLSTAAPLPETGDSAELFAATLSIMDMLNVEGAVDLHDHPLARYNQTEREDREEVVKAQEEGKRNPSARQVLVLNACLAPQQMAERRIRESCPSLAVPSASTRAPTTKAVPARNATVEPMETSTSIDREAAGKKTASSKEPDTAAENSAVEADRAL